MSPLSESVRKELREELERQLERLERSMSTTDEASRPVELDQQAVGRLSRMDSLQNQHMSRNLQKREQIRYAAIRRALDRMDDGTYGICPGCDEEIEVGRLMIMPEVEHCPICSV